MLTFNRLKYLQMKHKVRFERKVGKNMDKLILDMKWRLLKVIIGIREFILLLLCSFYIPLLCIFSMLLDSLSWFPNPTNVMYYLFEKHQVRKNKITHISKGFPYSIIKLEVPLFPSSSIFSRLKVGGAGYMFKALLIKYQSEIKVMKEKPFKGLGF